MCLPSDSAVCVCVLIVDKLFTLGDLAAFIKKHYDADGMPNVVVVDAVVDWKALLSDCIASWTGVKRPHAFRFKVCEAGGQRFVGMQYREFASDTTPWLGHRGSTNDADAIPVFSQLPRTTGSLPLAAHPVHLSPTLAAGVDAFERFFTDANAQVDRKSADSLGSRTIKWFRSILNNKTLGTARTAASPGVGIAASLPSPVFGGDAAVRLVGSDAKERIPTSATRPQVVAQPGWARAVSTFQLRLPEPSAVEKKARDRARKARSKLKELRRVAREIEAGSASESQKHCKPRHGFAALAGMDVTGDEPAAQDNPANSARSKKRRKSSAGTEASASAAGGSVEGVAVHADKKERSAVFVLPMDDKRDEDLLSKLDYKKAKGLIADGPQRVDVVCALDGRDQRVWRVSKVVADDDSSTFTVSLFQFRDIAITNVPPCRLRQHSALVPAD